MASNIDIARLPLPGNAELLVYLLVWLVLTLIWLFSDEVDLRHVRDADGRAHVRIPDQPRDREGEPGARAVAASRGRLLDARVEVEVDPGDASGGTRTRRGVSPAPMPRRGVVTMYLPGRSRTR